MLRNYLEKLLRQGATGRVIKEATEYFRHKPKPSPEALWVTVAACKACEKEQALGVALKWAEVAEEMKGLDPEAAGHLNFVLAKVHMRIGNWPRAECAVKSFMAAAEHLPALRPLIPWAYHNWALIERYLQREGPEISHLCAALEGYSAFGLRQQALHCRLEIAWSFLLREEPAFAFPYLKDALAAMDIDGTADLREDVETISALYRFQTHDLAAAEADCEKILARAGVTPRRAADAHWILGLIARARRDLVSASDHAELALDSALDDYWPPQVERINALRRGVMAH